MPGYTERDFETAIEAGLTDTGGYENRRPSAFDEALALFPEDVTGFLKESQPARWQALEALLGPKTAATVLDNLSKKLECEGMLNNEVTKAISPSTRTARDAFASKLVLALSI